MAVNFLVTGLKILKKSLDKKKMKEKAKKFVGGDKEEKRAKISKIMDKEGSYGGKTKAKKPATISKSKLMKIDIDKVAKVTPDSAKIDYKAFTEKVDNIVGMTDALAFLTGAQSEQKKNELELLRQQREAEKRRKKEAKLEKKDGMLGKVGKGIKKAAQKPLDAIIKFLTNIALGALALFVINNADKIKAMFENIGENIEKFGKILRVSIFAFKEGMNLAKASFKLMGKGIGKLLSPVSKAFKFIGSKFTSTLKLLGSSLKAAFMAIPGMAKLTKLTSDAVRGVTTGVDATSTAVRALSQSAKTKAVQSFNKVTGNVLSRGLQRAPTRLIIKIFGSSKAKSVMKAGKSLKNALPKGLTIPIVGPIIVAVTSILAGDPVGQILAKTLGTVIGGLIGSTGGPLGMIVGEIIGEFVGNTIYEAFVGDDKGVKGKALLKKKFDQLVNGVGKYGKMFLDFAMSQLGKVGDFFKKGMGRFIEDFPTVKVPEIKVFGLPLGLQTSLGKVSETLGLDKYVKDGRVEEIPDLSILTPFGMGKLLSHFKNSFFPSEQKETVDQNDGVIPGEASRKIEERNAKVKQIKDDLKDGKISKEEHDKMLEDLGIPYGGSIVKPTDDNIDATIDDSASGGETTTAELGEKDTSSTSSTVSDVSSKATYEELPAGTIILTKPERSDFKGRSGAANFKQAMIMYNNQKEMLNSYQKTIAKAELAKI